MIEFNKSYPRDKHWSLPQLLQEAERVYFNLSNGCAIDKPSEKTAAIIAIIKLIEERMHRIDTVK